jgi:hypothetical protein
LCWNQAEDNWSGWWKGIGLAEDVAKHERFDTLRSVSRKL